MKPKIMKIAIEDLENGKDQTIGNLKKQMESSNINRYC
jgi:hypothetical protein